MKVFISYSFNNLKAVVNLNNSLKKAGHHVFGASEPRDNITNDSLVKSLNKTLHNIDIIIVVITNDYLGSLWTQTELSAVIFRTNKSKAITIPLIIGNIQVPQYLLDIYCMRLTDFSEDNFKKIVEYLDNIELEKNNWSSDNSRKQINEQANRKLYLNNIKNALDENKLTLVCGAGVSIDAGIPDWNQLLLQVFKRGLNKNGSDVSELLNNSIAKFSSSNLILGKYLKILLGEDFEECISESLYFERENFFVETRLLKAIMGMTYPKQNHRKIESIITYNFDSLLEDILLKNNISYKAIYKEEMEYNIDELPIYHVHDFLPRNSNIDSSNIIFSEDSYHTQFIEPYSWSNLIQLYKLMNNICLFIGVSLTDPNLSKLSPLSRQKISKSW